MNYCRLLLRSAAWRWRQNLATAACIAVAVAVLVGAIVVGSSLEESLAGRMSLPLGDIRYAINLTYPIQGDRLPASVAGVLELRAVAGTETSQQTAVRVWRTGKKPPSSWHLPQLGAGEAAINDALASDLNVRKGDWIVLRVDVSPLRPETALFASRRSSETTQTMRVRVAAVLTEPWAAFSLQQSQATARNVFLGEDGLDGWAGLANRVLSSAPVTDEVTRSLQLSDFGVEMDARGMVARSRSVLFTPAQLIACRQISQPRLIGTYIAEEIRHGDEHVSYGIVAADKSIGLAADEVVLNDWVASDLGAKSGDRVTLSVLIARPDGSYGSEPVALTVKSILPPGTGLFRPDVAPEVRGITSAKRMDEWKTPFPVEMSRVTARDEAYWETHRASPKAIVSYDLLLRWWQRSGHGAGEAVTTVAFTEPVDQKALASAIVANEPNWAPVDLQAQAVAASKGSADFASLFGAMSAFLIVAGVIVSAGIVRLSIQTRLQEIGLAGSLGLSQGGWIGMILLEQGICATLGMLIGIAIGLGYAAALLNLFVRMAQGTWEIPPVPLSVPWTNLVAAGVGVAVVTLVAGWVQSRRELRRPVRELLWEIRSEVGVTRPGRVGLNGIIVSVCLVLAVTGVAVGWSGKADRVASFLVVSSAILAAGLFAARMAMGRMDRAGQRALDATRVTLRMMSSDKRRTNLNLLTFAFAFFVVSSVSLFRAGEPSLDVFDRNGPAGGFAVRIVSPIAYQQNLSTARAQGEMGIGQLPPDVHMFSLRVSDATEGGCLNLASPSEMQVIGLPAALVQRGGFDVRTLANETNPWALLERDDSGAIPVFGDEETMLWIAHRRLGDVFEMPVGGIPCRLRLVGMVRGGLFSGQLLMSEANYRRLLPNHEGFAMHLVECPASGLPRTLKALSPLAEYGMTVETTESVIRQVASVQRLYMTMFLVLGGLGLLLGSIGGAAMLARDVLARQGEIALLSAIGWGRGSVAAVVLFQHLVPVAAGIVLGLTAAIIGYMAMAVRPEPSWAVGIAAASLVAATVSYLAVFALAAPHMLGATLRAANT